MTPGVGPGHVSHQWVWFPPAPAEHYPSSGPTGWYNMFTGESYTAGQQALVSADINEFPLYVLGGVPIPMQPYTPRMGTAPLKQLVVRAYPGRNGSFELYEDDGVSRAYERGAFATTRLTYASQQQNVTVAVHATHGHFRDQPHERAITVELPDTGRALTASVNGHPVRSTYDPVTLTNRIEVPSGPIDREVDVRVHLAPVILDGLDERAQARRIAGVVGHRAGLREALSQAHDSAVRDELLATAGVGVVKHNMAPYLFGGTVRDEFYAPSGIVDHDAVHQVTGENIGVGGGVPLHGAVVMHRGHAVHRQPQVVLTLGGQSLRLPATTPFDELLDPANVAATARVTASASASPAEGAVDGVVGGYPNDPSQEWDSGQKTGWLQLDWDTPQTVDRVELYDRPGLLSQVTAGTLTLSDGTSIPVGPLPDDGSAPATLRFPARTVSWVRFTFTDLKRDSTSGGLGEIGVFRAAGR